MSMRKWDQPKPKAGTCLCGNRATTKDSTGWVCDRCNRLESMQRAEGIRRKTVGLASSRNGVSSAVYGLGDAA